MKFVYPLKGDNYDEKQTKARFGNFPISSFNTWHGGIHLEGAKKPLVAITNGRIIAYKIPDNYTDVCVDDITQQYSNGYILIQHDYKSTEGQELRFYSLYHHILPVSEMGDTTPFPSFLGKTTAIINKKEGWPVEGLNARISNGTAVDTTCTVKLIIPKGATVTLDPSENDSNLRLGKYVRVTYTDKNNITYDDIYIYKGISQVKELTSNTLEIITSEDKNEDKTVLGARVRKEGKGSADIIKIIPFEEEIIIDPNNKDSDKWVKLADNSGYIFKTSIKTTTVFDESKAKKNTVFACDIPVKAGELIGYVGKFGFTKYPSYDTCHFEIFTDASAAKVQDFLSNKKKDGKEDKTYYKLASGAELKPNLESSLTIPKNNRLKCLQIKGDYVKIKIIAQSEIVLRTDLDGHGKKSVLGKLKYQYTIKKDKVATINAIFGHSFDTTTKLYFGANVTNDSKKRKVLYIPDLCNKIYWVHKDNFSGTYKKNDEGYSDNGINTIFLDVPVTSKENPITVEKAIPKIKVLKTKSDAEKQLWLQISCTYEKESKKIKKQGWISQKDSKLEQINPFNWVDFDFHLLDAGNQYVYEVEGFNKLENTCDFVTEVWNILDDNEDKVINHQELQRAYRSDIKLEKLSKLICTHKNEWSYDAATIRSEAEQYFDIGINEEEDVEKKQQLENKKCALLDALEIKMTQLMWWQEVQSAVYTPPPAPAPKPDNQLVKNDNSQALIAKKQEEQQVEAPQASLASGSATKTTPTQELTQVSHQDTSTLEAESKNTTVTPVTTVSKKEEKSLPERAVPSTDIVHHFHPIGFIRQMRLIYGSGEIKPDIIFPLKTKPTNDIGEKWGKNYYWGASLNNYNQTIFKANRKGGRKHAGRDLYTKPYEEVVAVCDGKVLRVDDFYAQTHQVTIKHKTSNNKEFIFRYGELDPPSIQVKKGDLVKQGDLLGKTGKLIGITVIAGQEIYMLHPEIYDGSEGLDLTKSLSNSSLPFQRRADLIDPIEILTRGYNNTFKKSNLEDKNRVDPKTLKTSDKAVDFIKSWEAFKSKAYNDSEGFCTIGYGHLIKKKKCENIILPDEFKNGITKEKATKLFKQHLSKFEKSIQKDVKVKLSQNEFDSLVSFVFNTGEYFLTTKGIGGGHTKILKNINAEKYSEGAEEMRDVTNGGTLGLVKRRNAEIKMFKNNIYDSTH